MLQMNSMIINMQTKKTENQKHVLYFCSTKNCRKILLIKDIWTIKWINNNTKPTNSSALRTEIYVSKKILTIVKLYYKIPTHMKLN